MRHRHHLVFVSALLVLLTVRPAFAGRDADVDAGVAAFDAGDHDLAISKLEEALADPSTLETNNVPRAHYYLGKALLAAFQASGNSPDGPLVDAPLRAADAFLAVLSSGSEDWTSKLAPEIDKTLAILVGVGLNVIATPGALEHASVVEMGDQWTSKAMELRPHDHVLYETRGQLREAADRRDEAYQDYREGLAQFKAHPPATPDLEIGYLAYRAAMVSYRRPDMTTALAELEEGQEIVEAEWARIDAATAEQQQVHAQVTGYLGDARLAILRSVPELLQTALQEFEAAIQEDPTDYTKHVAYASLLEGTDPDAAIAMYEKAIAIDGTKDLAHFNLAAIYVNQGVQIFKQANEMEDYEAGAEHAEIGDALFRKALPHLESALNASPDHIPTLRALLQVTLRLDDMDAAMMYQERLEALY